MYVGNLRCVKVSSNTVSSLELGRNAFSSTGSINDLPDSKARYWWHVFRSIIFLECWFAYNTGRESRISEEDLALYRPASRTDFQLEDFQGQVGELGQLAAYMALDLRKQVYPAIDQAKPHFASLNDWHRTLPPPMQLSRLSFMNPPAAGHTRRSLFQLHILFLDLFIEPYREFLVYLGNLRLGDHSRRSEKAENMEVIEEQCILAASQSARLAALLLIDDLIKSDSWVSVYANQSRRSFRLLIYYDCDKCTCFTGCSLLLFGASQKLLLLKGQEVGHDLLYASSDLGALSRCSHNSQTAKALYATLQIIFNEIKEIFLSSVYSAMRENAVALGNADFLSVSQHVGIDGAEQTSRKIFDIAKRALDVLSAGVAL